MIGVRADLRLRRALDEQRARARKGAVIHLYFNLRCILCLLRVERADCTILRRSRDFLVDFQVSRLTIVGWNGCHVADKKIVQVDSELRVEWNAAAEYRLAPSVFILLFAYPAANLLNPCSVHESSCI